MLIRVRPDLFINTKQISAVLFYEDILNIQAFHLHLLLAANLIGSGAIVHCSNHLAYQVSQDAARFVCEMMEANTAAILPEDKDSEPEKPTLKAQIAQALRDTWKGATLGQLDAVFPDAGIPAIKAALAELDVEQTVVGIVKLIPDEAAVTLYYHASSSEAQLHNSELRTPHSELSSIPSPDPSTAAAALPDALHQAAEHNES